MVPLLQAQPVPALAQLSLFYTNEPLLENLPVLVFYGPSTTGNSTQNSSRIQAHIYSLAGFHSFPRLTVAPTSPLYAAVNNLPDDLQGDEVFRGLAIGLLSYFAAISKETKLALRELAGSHRQDHKAPMMFDEMHAADLASSMCEVENTQEIAAYITLATENRALSWIDLDVILPEGSVKRAFSNEADAVPLSDDNGLPLYRYGPYSAFIESLGAPAFLPTSKLQRAPSKSTSSNRSKVLSKDQKVSLRREMCEFVDTESNYLQKLRDLVSRIRNDFRPDTPSEAWQKLFPRCLVDILDVNESFFREIQTVLDDTESDAINDIEGEDSRLAFIPDTVTQGRRRDPTGALHFAKTVHKWFPDFRAPYQEYLRCSADFYPLIARLSTDKCSKFLDRLHEFGEQYLRSALIEPVQRLPRYSLLIDNMAALLPASHAALPSLFKARDIVNDICAIDGLDNGNSALNTRYLLNTVQNWPKQITIQGRLVTAVDALELHPPYAQHSQGLPTILLIFPGKVVVLRRFGQTAISARGLLAEIDYTKPMVGSDPCEPAMDKGLHFESAHDLQTLRISESIDGHLIYMTEVSPGPLPPNELLTIRTRVFSLQAPYHGKASRLTEEFVKAAVEGRYPNDVRESDKWSLRSIDSTKDDLGMIVAISGLEGHQSLHDLSCMGQLRLFIDIQTTISSMVPDEPLSIAFKASMDVSHGGYTLAALVEGGRFEANCTAETLGKAVQRQGKFKRLIILFKLILRSERHSTLAKLAKQCADDPTKSFLLCKNACCFAHHRSKYGIATKRHSPKITSQDAFKHTRRSISTSIKKLAILSTSRTRQSQRPISTTSSPVKE